MKTRYQISDDDIVLNFGKLILVPRALLDDEGQVFAADQGPETWWCVGYAREDGGVTFIYPAGEFVHEALEFLASFREQKCQWCWKGFDKDDDIVLPAGGDLEWSLHRYCCDDRRSSGLR